MTDEANKVVLILLREKDFTNSLFIHHHHYWEHGNKLTEHFNRIIHHLEEVKAIHISKKPNEQRDYYSLTESTRKLLENRPVKYLDRPYEYLLKHLKRPLKERYPTFYDLGIGAFGAIIGAAATLLFSPKEIQVSHQDYQRLDSTIKEVKAQVDLLKTTQAYQKNDSTRR